VTERGDRRRVERVRADWSARFESGASVVIGHVVNLSMVSVRIRPESSDPAAAGVGQPGTLTLAFLDSVQHMEVIRLAATVVRVGVDGMAFRFTGLPDSASRWLGARVLTTEVRRRAPRVPLALPIELRAPGGAPFPAEMLDLSAYGARVSAPRAPQPVEAGNRLQVTFELSSGQPIAVSAVVWSVEGDEAVLMFVHLGPREFNLLGDPVASRLGSRG
jgi:PilZ domain-containing protein